MVPADLLEMLRCPVCVREAGKQGTLDFVKETWLVCPECGRKYPVVDDIPVMLVEEGEKWMQTPVDSLPVPPPNPA